VRIVVAGRYNGPAGSGNGGYTCGLVAAAYGVAPAEVTLRRPPPLDTSLDVRDDGVYDGDAVVATVTPADLSDVTPPMFAGHALARAAERYYAGLRDHPFPTCFVCGPDRDDGLHLRPGPVMIGGVATGWVPGDDVTAELVWAALDCPGAWALMQTDEAPIVLGRLAVEIHALPRPGMPCVVTGWRHAERQGRKHYAGTALHDIAGTLLARGRATWVALQSSGAS
jgi:hypothetical protein